MKIVLGEKPENDFAGGDGGIRTHGAFHRSNDFESFPL